jgi:magnesium transporter
VEQSADFAAGCASTTVQAEFPFDIGQILMLTVYVHDKGSLAPSDWKGGVSLPPETVWIDLLRPTSSEEATIEAALRIDIPVREKLAEIEASSRLYTQGDAIFMTATIISRADGDKPEIDAITFIVKGQILVTVRYCEPRSFDIFIARSQRPEGCPPTGDGVFISLLEAIVDRAADHLERVGTIAAATSKEVFQAADGKSRNFTSLLRRIGEEGDFTSDIRESLVSLSRLTAFYTAVFDLDRKTEGRKVQRSHLKTLQRDLSSLTDHASFLSDKISFILDATLGMITIEQNAIIKIFSVAAVVFLPPTLIASIYGMNFQVMPELEWIAGYPFALGLMIASVLATFIYFRRKGWM